MSKNESEKPVVKHQLNLSQWQIIGASLASGMTVKTTTNVIEVATTRILKDTIFCRPATCPGRQNCTTCLPSRNLFKVIPYIIQKNGWTVIFNGIFQNYATGFARTLSFFPVYEYCKDLCFNFKLSNAKV